VTALRDPGAPARLDGRAPRYVRIAEALRRRLSRTPGAAARLPSEPALAREFQVSRETVRGALAVLRDEGLIYSRAGRGTFVSPGRRQVGVRITQPINEPYVAGRPSVLRVLEQGFVAAPPEVGRALGVPAGRPVFRYLSLRTIRGHPFRYGCVYLPEAVARRLDLRRPPVLTVSERVEREAGIRLIRAHQVVVAAAAPAEVAARFGVAPGAPVLMFRRTYYRDTGQPAEFVLEYQNAGRFPYEEALIRTAARDGVRRPGAR
jgi:DNA-binding GntR family transcriptional regulator